MDGSDEYKKKCVEPAIRHNLGITNPNLAAQVAEDGKHMTQQKGRRIKLSTAG